MKKKLLSALIAMSLLATASISALAAPVYEIVSGQGTVSKDTALEGHIYQANTVPGNPDLEIIFVKAPTKLLFAVYNKNVESGALDTGFASARDGYYFQNLGTTSLDVTIAEVSGGTISGDATGKTAADLTQVFSNIDTGSADSEKITTLNANQVALGIKLLDTNLGRLGEVVDVTTSTGGGNKVMGRLVAAPTDGTAAPEAKFRLVGKYSNQLPAVTTQTDFNIKFKYDIVAPTVTP